MSLAFAPSIARPRFATRVWVCRQKSSVPRCSATPPDGSNKSSNDENAEPQWDVLSQRISTLREQQEQRDQVLALNWRKGQYASSIVHATRDCFVRTLCFVGDHLACGTSTGDVHFLHMPSNRFFARSQHNGQVTASAYLNGIVASAGLHDRSVAIWDANALERNLARTSHAFPIEDAPENGQILRTVPVAPLPPPRVVVSGHEDTVTSLAIEGRGSVVYSGSADGTVRAHDTNTGALIYSTRVGEPVHAILLTDAGYLLTACASGRVHAYAANRGLFLMSILAHTQHVTAIAFEDETQTLLTGDAAGNVKLWALEESRCIVEKRLHSDAVVALQVDGAKILSAARDGQVAISERGTLTGLYAFGGFTQYIRSAAFDETKLIADGTNDIILSHCFNAGPDGNGED